MIANAPIDWPALIQAAAAAQPVPIQARTYVRIYQTASTPVELICADGNTYVVKCQRPGNVEQGQQGQMMFNDQTAGRLGRAMGAPVPDVALIDVPAELIAQNPEMAHIAPGLAHGSKKVPNVTERVNSFDHADKGTNRQRFASLAIFFGWLFGSDRQFIFEKSDPYRVYSHDHGHFFHGGPPWTPATLNAAPLAQAQAEIVAALNCTLDELRVACGPLHMVTSAQIAEAIAIPPMPWAFGLPERVALAEYLHRRRGELIAAFPIP